MKYIFLTKIILKIIKVFHKKIQQSLFRHIRLVSYISSIFEKAPFGSTYVKTLFSAELRLKKKRKYPEKTGESLQFIKVFKKEKTPSSHLLYCFFKKMQNKLKKFRFHTLSYWNQWIKIKIYDLCQYVIIYF